MPVRCFEGMRSWIPSILRDFIIVRRNRQCLGEGLLYQVFYMREIPADGIR